MKVRPSSKITDLKPNVLYLDDIIYLAKLVSDSDRRIKFSFSCNGKDYQCEDIKDIEKLESLDLQDIDDALLESSNADKTNSLNTNFRYVWEIERSPYTSGLCNQLKDYINERVSRLHHFDKLYYIAVAGYAIGYPIYIFSTDADLPVVYDLLWGMCSLLLLILVISGKEKWHQYSEIKLVKRKDTPNFWQRNKDQIVVSSLIAVASIIGTLIATDYFKNEEIPVVELQVENPDEKQDEPVEMPAIENPDEKPE